MCFFTCILTAAIRNFTNYNTLNEYTDACKEDNLPPCYIGIDVAHFIKKYSNFLKDSRLKARKINYMNGRLKIIHANTQDLDLREKNSRKYSIEIQNDQFNSKQFNFA